MIFIIGKLYLKKVFFSLKGHWLELEISVERGGQKPYLGLGGNGRLRNGGNNNNKKNKKKKWRQMEALSSKESGSEEKERNKKVANKQVRHTRSRKGGR